MAIASKKRQDSRMSSAGQAGAPAGPGPRHRTETDGGGDTADASLRQYRFRAGLTQSDLAARAGLSLRAVRYIEQGRVARPQASSMRRLAEALGLTGPERDALIAGPGTLPPTTVMATTSPPPDAATLRIEVLGPLTVRRGPLPVEIESAMLGDLLGLLAIQPRQVVSVEEIVDTLWGEEPPRTCVALIHTYVSQLRRLLEPARLQRAPGVVLPRVRGGYRLDLDGRQLDLAEFDESVAQGRAASADDAIDAAWAWYTRAAALWRGPLLADGAMRLRNHAVAVAIGQRRVAAALEHADIALVLGLGDQLLGALRILAGAEPLNERLTARLMLVLASCGQQAAALELFASARERLNLELGVGPGRELQAAQLRVLRAEEPEPVPAAPAVLSRSDVVPAQLPAAIASFTGRAGYVKLLDNVLPPNKSAPTPTMIVAVVGMGGVGKTALVVHWAYLVRDRFPDGQLYVNLRGHAAADHSDRSKRWSGSCAHSACLPTRYQTNSIRPRRCTVAAWPTYACWWSSMMRPAWSRSGRCCRAVPARSCWSPAAGRWEGWSPAKVLTGWR